MTFRGPILLTWKSMAPANQGLMSDSHHDPRMEGRGSSWKATKMSSPGRQEGGRNAGLGEACCRHETRSRLRENAVLIGR